MKVIGLTGGIASGKSTAARILQSLGAVTIDSDQIARRIVEPGKPAWKDIVEYFGPEILNKDSSLNRIKLGLHVFSDPGELQKLNNITHPRIMEAIREELQRIKGQSPQAVVVLEVPLLYETKMDSLCDTVWVVWVDRDTQIERLMARDRISREEAVRRIESQLSLDEKAQRADLIIDNSGDGRNMQEELRQHYCMMNSYNE